MTRAIPSLLLAAALAAIPAGLRAQLPQVDAHAFPTPVAGPVSPADVLRQTGHWQRALASGGFPALSPASRPEADAALARLQASLARVRSWRQLRPPQVERIVADHAQAVTALGLGDGERLSCRTAAATGTRIAQMECHLAGRQAEAGGDARRRLHDATSGRVQ